jgi:hypothetical protein
MPIEIKELVIRATVDPGAGDVKKAPTGDLNAREEIIAECVEQVLEILRRKKER